MNLTSYLKVGYAKDLYGKSVRNNKPRNNFFLHSLRHNNYQVKQTKEPLPNKISQNEANKQESLKNALITDSVKASQKEQFVLKASMFGALALAIFGIGFGILVKSMSVIFDGFVALVSVGLGFLSVVTSRYIYKEDDDIFQYGYVRFEPMVNLFKSLVLVFVCVYAFINALQSIVNGGYEIELGGAMVYSLCAFIFCIILFYYTLIYAGALESDLIKVDNTEWKIDCVLYFGGLVAFGMIYLLPYINIDSIIHSESDFNQQDLARYIDPALLLVLSLLLCVSPIRIAIANFKDLMMVAPVELDSKITQIMEDLSLEFGFSDYDTHVAKSGRFYMVEVNILTQKNFKPTTMQEFDFIRERIEKALEIPSYKIWLSVSFTANPKWL
ncbi:cation diffusion facilitator family transporter [Helicobacter sp. MIT 14-3879]|uniref:cation diffusion facilitator family transporter n=1 Tax=Helicobacter sp. MIT 14-3879 TaxID=2040649 RepID=UPI000E1EB8DF|nr:cation transporter [Helicobacter sp. MIT 14-3879]RDU61367.1 cation transporter [Helicobacter sp. MIT 14-3879]